jgi:hypothetical protein
MNQRTYNLAGAAWSHVVATVAKAKIIFDRLTQRFSAA